MCERRVDLLVCSLPLHRHSYIGFILAFASSIHNEQKRRVNLSVRSLPLHRHSYIGFIFSFRFFDSGILVSGECRRPGAVGPGPPDRPRSFRSSSNPDLNGKLHWPNDMDKSLNETATDKIRKYRADCNNNPNAISFMPATDSTSGRLHSEFIRILFLQTHRETDHFYNTVSTE